MDRDLFVTLAIIFLATVHLLAGNLRFLSRRPRSRWLSAGGGVGVAYVFLHLMPDLQVHHSALREAAGGVLSPRYHAYVIALVGLVVFYSVERWAERAQERGRAAEPVATRAEIFWVSTAAFALYNALLCYLIVRELNPDSLHSFLYPLAIAIHFTVNDHGMYHRHKRLYVRYGRIILAAAAVLGGIGARFLVVPEAIMAGLMAFLIGSMILNVLKEELPEAAESRIVPFVVGAFGYAALLLV